MSAARAGRARPAAPPAKDYVENPVVVRINGMRFWGRHGVGASERSRAQPIDVDLEIHSDTARAARSDALKDAVDYHKLFDTCGAIVANRSFHLLEALARAIIDAVWQDPRVRQVTVRVRKPRLFDGATPEIEMRRQRPS